MGQVSEPTKVELLCIPCMHATQHTITYVNRRLVSLECDDCHHRVEVGEGTDAHTADETRAHRVSLLEIEQLYTAEFLHRILTKPHRMGEQLQEDLSLFLVTLPLRLITKPYRLMKEVLRHEDHGDPRR